MLSNIIRSNQRTALSRSELLDIVKSSASKIIKTMDYETFDLENSMIYSLVESIRMDNRSLAHEIYTTFFNELMYPTNQYSKGKKEYLKYLSSLNFTEIYYNIGKLKWDSGDYDNSLYYLIEADEEHKRHTHSKSADFIKSLIQSNNYVLWNFIPFIVSDYRNFKRNISGLENPKISNWFTHDNIYGLIDSISLRLLCQLINSINRFHNFSALKPNGYHLVREAHTIGELAWLFDCYLKEKLNVTDGTLDNLITGHLLKGSINIKKIYADLSNKIVRKSRNEKIYAIEKLVIELKGETNFDVIIAKSLFITNIVRNYNAHYIDHEYYRTTEHSLNREVYLIILACILFSNDLLTSEKSD